LVRARQAAVVFSVLAVTSGGQMLRHLAAGGFGLADGLAAPRESRSRLWRWRCLNRSGVYSTRQYLFVDYASQDPIHLLTPIVTLFAFAC